MSYISKVDFDYGGRRVLVKGQLYKLLHDSRDHVFRLVVNGQHYHLDETTIHEFFNIFKFGR